MTSVQASDTTIVYPYGFYEIKLVATNQFGCADSITRSVFVDILTNMYVPTAFVPGHPNPELAVFRPKAFNLKTYSISIYDVWGNLIWFSNKLIGGQPLEGWDGTYDGQALKSDCYVWKIDASFNDGVEWHGNIGRNGKVSKYGNVMLLR